MKFGEACENLEVLFLAFAEADAWIDNDTIGGDTGGFGDIEGSTKEEFDLGDDVARGFAELGVIVHENRGGSVTGDQVGHGGVALKAVNVVNDVRAGFEGSFGDGGVIGVD